MGIYFEGLIWKIDLYLLGLEGFVIFVILGVIFSYKIKRSYINRQIDNLRKKVGTCSLDDEACFAAESLPVLKNIGIEIFVNMLQNKGNIQDKAILAKIRQNLLKTKEIAEVEKIAVRGRNKWKRIEAILALSYINPSYALKVVSQTIYDKDEDIVSFSLEALRNIRTNESAQIILEGIKKHIYSGYKAASIVSVFPCSVAEVFAKEIDSEDENLRFWCIRIIAHLKASQYSSQVANHINDISANVRSSVCEYLGLIKANDLAEMVLEKLSDNIWFVRLRALQSIEQIMAGDCIDNVAPLIRDKSWAVVETAKQIMVKYPMKSIRYAKEYLFDIDTNIHKIGVEIIDASRYTDKMLEGILSSDDKEREESVEMLRIMLKTGVEIELEPALRESSEHARNLLIKIIGTVDGKKAKQLQDIMEKRKR
ncbi:MAG: hypothetical protein PHQ52_02515 [Candidatus Omnitrophica bacterium]|nr:hypothetical protein [Candidatus Omnitrophota bacterium]